jgi:membrane protease YdiL (CAAX protease family)
MSAEAVVSVDQVSSTPTVHWRQVGAFLGLTFALTWLLNLAMYLQGGLTAPGVLPLLQLQMLIPAFSAILLGLFFFPSSPIYRSRPAGKGRWFYYFFLALTVVYALGALALWLSPGQSTLMAFSSVAQLLALIGLILLIVLRLVARREGAASVGLLWGSWKYWLGMGAAIVVYYVIQAALNAVTGLGGAQYVMPAGVQGMDPLTFAIVGGLQTVVLGPIIGLVIAFGEEYGWRGYLQSELFKMGRVKGVLLLGVIWGAWHWPIILMGYNYPGHPLLGVLLMTLWTTGLAVVLGFAVLKTGSVILAAFLHGLNNQALSFLFMIGFAPHDPVLSFGLGVFGIISLAVVALLLLRDPVWRGKENRLGI